MKRKQGRGIKSWELTDGLWEIARQFIQQRKRDEGKTYKRRSGGGRKPLPPRRVLEGIFFVLRTGIQWKALPREYGAAGSVRRYFSEWAQAGFFRQVWAEGLMTSDELHRLGWEWQSADGCMVKAPPVREPAGNNPTDRGDETQSCGQITLLPGIAIDGANRHDIKLLEGALCSIAAAHPEGANLCLDAGYGGAHDPAVEPGYAPHIRFRGEERQEKAVNSSFKARRG